MPKPESSKTKAKHKSKKVLAYRQISKRVLKCVRNKHYRKVFDILKNFEKSYLIEKSKTEQIKETDEEVTSKIKNMLERPVDYSEPLKKFELYTDEDFQTDDDCLNIIESAIKNTDLTTLQNNYLVGKALTFIRKRKISPLEFNYFIRKVNFSRSYIFFLMSYYNLCEKEKKMLDGRFNTFFIKKHLKLFKKILLDEDDAGSEASFVTLEEIVEEPESPTSMSIDGDDNLTVLDSTDREVE